MVSFQVPSDDVQWKAGTTFQLTRANPRYTSAITWRSSWHPPSQLLSIRPDHFADVRPFLWKASTTIPAPIAIWPHDVKRRGPITDDELFELFSARPAGVRVVMISKGDNDRYGLCDLQAIATVVLDSRT